MDTQRYNVKSASGAYEPPCGAAPTDGRFPAGEEAWQSSGTWDEFPQPRGWAMDWDGFALSALQEAASQYPPTPGTVARADGALPHG